MDDAFSFLSLGLTILNTLLLFAFLSVFLKFIQGIRPLIEKFTGAKGGFKMPTIKEAIGYGLYKIIETTDLSKLIPGVGGKK